MTEHDPNHPERQHDLPIEALGAAALGSQPEMQAEILRLRREVKDLHYRVTHDFKTGALSEAGLAEYLEGSNPPIAVLFLDVTNFKAINDEISHPFGDTVLKKTHDLVVASVRPGDVIARVGGDEFAVLLVDTATNGFEGNEHRGAERQYTTQEITDHTVQRIRANANVYFNNDPDLAKMSPRPNVAVDGVIWQEGMTTTDLLEAAEVRMKAHKRQQHDEGGQYR